MTHQPAKPDPSQKENSTAKLWLRSLDDIEGADLPLVGGKAFRLATLKQHGLNVPPGLALTTAFFEAQLRFAQFVPLWAGSPDVAVTTDSLIWLSEMLKTKPLTKELTGSFNQAMDNLFGPEIDRFAVRSSAVDEDQRDHTFAGVHRTELGVPRNLLPIAITRCWASALDHPALDYRQAHGMSIQSIRIALLIQPMLTPRSSGVGFTVNPLTGARDEFIIEATWGLGEAVVSGQVQPYFYRLSACPPDYPLLEQRSGSALAPDDTAGVPLSPGELTQLARQLEQIRALMGEAQDVEWAQQDGHFFFLQTRPVAALPEPIQTVELEWTRGNHPEFLPELPSPLLASIFERVQRRGLNFFEELGLQVDGLGPYLKLILGRPYLNLTFLKRMSSQVGLPPNHLLPFFGHTEPSGGRLLSIDWGTAWRMRHIHERMLKRLMDNSRQLKTYQSTVDEIISNLNDLNFEAPPSVLLAQLRLQERLIQEWFSANLGLDMGLAAATAIGSSLIAPLTKTPTATISALALQGLPTAEREFNQALLKLSQLTHRQPEVKKYLDDLAGSELTAPPPPEFVAAFDDLLARYGHRAVYETDMSWPRYHDDPRLLLSIIRRYAQDAPPSGPVTDRLDQPDLTWSRFISQTKGWQRWLPWRCGLAAPLVKMLRHFLHMRDDLNRAKARAVAACRRWDLALGERWVERSWLARPDDIFWLTLEEIERALLVEAETGFSLAANVQARQDTYRAYAETPLPFNLGESQIPLIQLGVGLLTEMTADVRVGLPISPGQIRGTILVLRHPDEFERIADDIILVTPSTDPAWLPLLRRASGLIVEMGGLLSHGSVIAREYGLPAVANIVNATQVFHTGDIVLVDGSTGIVQVLESASP